MSSINKTQKFKTICKNSKTTVHSTKTKVSATKSESFINKFKNLDMETATQLPPIEEEKLADESSLPANNIAITEQEPQPVIRYENGMIEVDIWASHEHKDLWDSLIGL